MTLHTLLAKDAIQIVFDDAKRLVLLEMSSGGYRERYVAMHIEHAADIDDIVAGLLEAKRRLTEEA
ncbi:hypothetical protein [Paenibacillus sp.]|uniref:hypothetical protein n=1 Tax=Paenibacillus sp. TaxID=58172 RepID=UPI002D6A1E32|nr:hypothetical protein [Paenibacillus sp.]HZG56297.1 hypothetical protein [Paenibacillus sp.]